MKLLFIGDVVGKAGRRAVGEHLPRLREVLQLDAVIVNGENAAGGFGITEKTAEELFRAGADVITLGNHAWDKREILSYIDREPRLLRPLNYPRGEEVPGRGANLYHIKGYTLLVMNVLGRIFMDSLDDPFVAVQAQLDACFPGRDVDAIVLDFHAEASSEKMAMGHFCDGRASLVVGTHTHVPTADHHILPGGTAYQTDAGMTGDYNSVIGMDKTEPLRRYQTRLPGGRFQVAEGEATLCGLVVETDKATGLATACYPLRLGGVLSETQPPLVGNITG